VNYSHLSAILTDSLGLSHAPVSITFTNSIPAGVPSFRGHPPAGCRFWQDARAATFATAAGDHASCAIGMYTHNLEQGPREQADLGEALAVFRELDYVKETDLPLIPVMKFRAEHVVYGPLAETTVEPAVVILFVNSSQALIASEAAQQIENRIVPAMGRPACAVVPLVANADASAVSFGCCGARAYLETFTPELSIFAIPGKKLELYAEHIQTLATANSTLTKFHRTRERQIAAGLTPTVKESLAALCIE
jgi:uncharacterized protein (DUF169 family)